MLILSLLYMSSNTCSFWTNIWAD